MVEFSLRPEDGSLCLVLFGDGLSSRILEIKQFGGHVDRNPLFKHHFNESLSNLTIIHLTL